MNEKNDGFRIVDKRVCGDSNGSKEKEKNENLASSETKKGEGFVMKEKKSGEQHVAKIDFSTLVLSFATQAMINLGMTDEKTNKKEEKDLIAAQQNIDILSLLQEKTKGNLTKDETELLSNVLTHLKLSYVEASKS